MAALTEGVKKLEAILAFLKFESRINRLPLDESTLGEDSVGWLKEAGGESTPDELFPKGDASDKAVKIEEKMPETA